VTPKSGKISRRSIFFFGLPLPCRVPFYFISRRSLPTLRSARMRISQALRSASMALACVSCVSLA
jgi:hypothetical protein